MDPIEILLVEDNPGDVLLIQEVLQENKVINNLHVTQDGVEASQFLRQQGEYASVPLPDLILLDLNLPRKDGKELLAEIKQDADLHLIPVVILTTSAHEQDILDSYSLHANAYVTKPVGLDQFVDIVRQIEEFWLSIVRFPEIT